ncbi:MAG: hypothetical protein A2Y23_00525 [Clostridiales bacterium GWB2_37_7]|nr:MAG: hypothetical protein A2Y23_00525 [Clostridiales bacterium GWB2_37_7]
MKNNIDNQKDVQIIHKLRKHLFSLPDEKPRSLLPDCNCMKYARPFIRKRLISGKQVCHFCKYLKYKPNKEEGCPFKEDD